MKPRCVTGCGRFGIVKRHVESSPWSATPFSGEYLFCAYCDPVKPRRECYSMGAVLTKKELEASIHDPIVSDSLVDGCLGSFYATEKRTSAGMPMTYLDGVPALVRKQHVEQEFLEDLLCDDT